MLVDNTIKNKMPSLKSTSFSCSGILKKSTIVIRPRGIKNTSGKTLVLK
jgi:hypothetical protein